MSTAIQLDAALPAAAARRLRVLMADEALPFPPDSGKRLRTWHLLRRLARRHDIVLVAYGSGSAAADAAAVAALAAAGLDARVVPPPPAREGWRLYAALAANCASPWPYSVAKHHSRRFAAALRSAAAQPFDLLHIEWTPYASHAGADLPPMVIASHNLEAHIWRRRAEVASNPAARLFFASQARKMERFEGRAFRRARWVTTVSAGEREVAGQWGAARTSVVANGVDLDQFQPRPEPPVAGRLLFLGALDWFANQDAVEYCVQQMLPRIRLRFPGAHLQIVGRRPPAAWRRQLATQPGVELVGEVDDVRQWLAQAAVVLVPLRIGGGSRIKILEALAMEKAVVSTSVGAEGLELRDGLHLLLADVPEQFAQLAAQLLAAPAQAARLGRAGASLVAERYSWDAAAAALDAAWRQAAGCPRVSAHGGAA